VFGYDVLIDEDHRPWLLEVNASPSMARENKLDETVRHTTEGSHQYDPFLADSDSLEYALISRYPLES
jgi:D-alanine-D-alanine ligase-like ATP-grasp enzyme